MRFLAVGVGALLLVAIALQSNQAGEKGKPKFTISQVMKTAHAGDDDSLLSKVAAGEADAKEKAQLVELYKALSQNKPPMGDEKNWKEITSALVKASEAAAKGEDGAGKSLVKIANCNGCHAKFRPKKDK